MRNIIYYVAISIDGYISSTNNDISDFKADGDGVAQYLKDLQSFDTVIMGRRTYEFGYQYGLEPGQPPYPHMQHYIFSNTLQLRDKHPLVHVEGLSLDRLIKIKEMEGTDIYLCGGGVFAGWLLNNQLIDRIKIKLNPLILGSGIPMFVGVKRSYQLQELAQQNYDDLQIVEYVVTY